jgi:uncharacterized protein (DUF58 family)
MSDVAEFVHHRDLQKIANLQVLARFVVEGFCSGLHRSPHKGFSVEFKQHRQYVPGDDIRYLDWKVFGKSDRFFVREYEAETNLRATLLVDVSGSMAYGDQASSSEGGSGRIAKYEYAIRLAVCLAYVMLAQQDAVGLLTFDTAIRNYIPPRSRPKHLKTIIDELARREPGRETELAGVFHQVVPKIHRRGLLLILSDCFGDVPEMLNALAHFRHVGHEVIIFQLWDRDELEFPFKQWTRFECLERLGLNHIVDPAHLRASYLHKLEEYRESFTKGCRRHRIDLVPMVTDQPYAEALAHYLALRKRRT